jgi:hypothetical protein
VTYQRRAADGAEVAMVFLNFSGSPQTVAMAFPEVGTYQEMIDRDVIPRRLDILVTDVTQAQQVTVPSHYGRIYIK